MKKGKPESPPLSVFSPRIIGNVEGSIHRKGRMSIDVFQMNTPRSTKRREFATHAAPGSKVALLAVVLAVTGFMRGGGLSAALALVNRVMVFNRLVFGDGLLTEDANHIAIPL